MSHLSDYQGGVAEALRSAIDHIANQLAVAVDGRFEFVVKPPLPDETLDKLVMLINFVVETARRTLVAQQELERLRSEWSSVVAHDLRQPLGSIILHAMQLARSSGDPAVLARAERIHAAGNRLNRMVGDLMDLSRLDASRLQLARQRVDLAALVRAAAEQAGLQAPDRPFEVRVQGTVPDVDADPDRVMQVLENLLTNAVKYGKAATPVVARIASDGREVAVSVTNEGSALTPEESVRIFERFQRTDSAKLHGIKGVGLGLYITRSLVEAHGGRITADSSPEGVTTFRFTLPR